MKKTRPAHPRAPAGAGNVSDASPPRRPRLSREIANVSDASPPRRERTARDRAERPSRHVRPSYPIRDASEPALKGTPTGEGIGRREDDVLPSKPSPHHDDGANRVSNGRSAFQRADLKGRDSTSLDRTGEKGERDAIPNRKRTRREYSDVGDASPPRRPRRSRDPSPNEPQPGWGSRDDVDPALAVRGNVKPMDSRNDEKRGGHPRSDPSRTSARSSNPGGSPISPAAAIGESLSGFDTVRGGESSRPKHQQRISYNRYKILAGPRWDGIDRSNGFENKLDGMRADRRDSEQRAFMRSVSDM